MSDNDANNEADEVSLTEVLEHIGDSVTNLGLKYREPIKKNLEGSEKKEITLSFNVTITAVKGGFKANTGFSNTVKTTIKDSEQFEVLTNQEELEFKSEDEEPEEDEE